VAEQPAIPLAAAGQGQVRLPNACQGRVSPRHIGEVKLAGGERACREVQVRIGDAGHGRQIRRETPDLGPVPRQGLELVCRPSRQDSSIGNGDPFDPPEAPRIAQ